MTGDSSTSVGDASNSGGPDVALAELGRAITRAADALAALPSNDAGTAYRCARALDAAFDDLTDLLQIVPGIVGLGNPGRKVSERLEQRRAELATRRSEIAAYRARLGDLAEIERSLAEKMAEADRLRERVSELERAKQLAAEIPGLRIHVQALEEALTSAERGHYVGDSCADFGGGRQARHADRATAGSDRRRGGQACRRREESR